MKPKIKEYTSFLRLILPINIIGITLAPFGIYIKRLNSVSQVTINHEDIHWKQQMEMLILPFYIWYLLEWGIRIIGRIFGFKHPYKNISFEREAYENAHNTVYSETRKSYSWLKYIFNKKGD